MGFVLGIVICYEGESGYGNAGPFRFFSFSPLRDKVAAQLQAMSINELTCDMNNYRLGEEQVQMQVDAHFVNDVLRGNEVTEMRVTLVRIIDDELPPGED